MYQVLLVEDEATVREGIVQKIDWHAHGFSLAGACENGKQALDILETQTVEVIITDINMPVMDGLTLSKQVYQKWPDTKVVILTGFDDFSYAQAAIRYKVHEYILKPITARQLRELLDRLRWELDARPPSIEHARGLMRESFLERILSEEVSADEMEKRIREFLLDLEPSPCCTALAGVPGAVDIPSDFMDGVRAISAGRGEILRDGGRLTLLCCGPNPEKSAVTILRAAAARSAQPVSAVVGGAVEHAGMLFHSHAEARRAWEHLYRMPSAQILLASDLLCQPPREPALGNERRAVLREVKLQNRELAADALSQFVGHIMRSTWGRDAVLAQMQKLVLLLAEYAEEQELAIPEGIMEQLAGQPNLHSAHRCLQNFIDRLMDEGERWGDSTSRQGVLAVEYIKENYKDPNLSLQQITAFLSVSTSSFSVLFKKHTGVTFVEFLTRLRMNKAQELILATDMKNYEIASDVGYDDPGYFSSTFKKFTTLSPSEYRKKYRG